MISSITPSDRQNLKFLVEHLVSGMHQAEAEKIRRLLHTPFGTTPSAPPKVMEKEMTLIGNDALSNFRQKERFPDSLVSLAISVSFLL
jgi:hypothetical protein